MRRKDRHNRELLLNGRTALHLSLNIGIIMFFLTIISFFYARVNTFGANIRLSDVLTINYVYNLLFDILFLYILFRFEFFVIKRTKEDSRKRVLWLLLGSVLLIMLLSPTLSTCYWSMIPDRLPRNIILTISFVKHSVMLLVTLLMSAMMIMWKKQQAMSQENQQLLIENMQSRYDVLKSQLDPHFLFNSLNTLNGLIGIDDKKAHEYVEQLSEVFRYSIQTKPIIQLSEELNFVESYAYLMKIRYGEALDVRICVDDKYLNYYILPCGLQLLFENAVKHNIISNKYPLTICIETSDDNTIIVQNNLQPKKGQTESGVGLVNLKERYRLMFGKKDIKITSDEASFIVELPLIEDFDNKTMSILATKTIEQ